MYVRMSVCLSGCMYDSVYMCVCRHGGTQRGTEYGDGKAGSVDSSMLGEVSHSGISTH